MRRNKIFVKKSKKGSVLRVVREHYLRDDIWCGSEACKLCQYSQQYTQKPVLDAQPSSVCNAIHSAQYYVLADTNIFLHQIDVLDDPSIKNVIVLQTVLEEVRHRNTSIYKRLREILGNKDRRFFAFVNEFHKDTYIDREPGESANDRNDRAIRTAAAWYNQHLESNGLQILLISDDKENRVRGKSSGVTCLSMREYIESLRDCSHLLDKLSKSESDISSRSHDEIAYPDHLPLAEIHQKLKSGQLKQGKFDASRENYLEGWVRVEGHDVAFFLQGRHNLNRAVQDDMVAVEILPESEWGCPSSIVLEDDEVNEDDDEKVVEEEENISKRNKKKKSVDKLPSAKVIGIIKRKWRQYCGILEPPRLKEATKHLFIPAEKKIPKIRIETRQAEALQGQRIIVAIDSWPKSSRYPLGHFVRQLGEIGDKDTENEVLLLEHDIPHTNFSQSVLQCLPTLPWIITDDDVKQRRDLRHLHICSVDPPGCTDIDDALHCFKLPNGNYQVGVHIADVSHFIRPYTAIDAEAASRGTTVYLVDKRIDMVPDLLSSNLCSLRSNEERFAFSCIWEVDEDAHILHTAFTKSIINSKAALTYAEAQLIIDDASQDTPVARSLRQLNTLAKVLKRRRMENGALTLASTEVRFEVDSETHDPIDLQTKQLRDTNSMVEEFMLLANISVAEKIYEEFPQCALLRRHPAPPPSNYDPIIQVAKSKGFDLDVNSNKSLSLSLDMAVIANNPYFNTMLRILATRCMMQAVYFSSGMVSYEDYLHYGLATPIYTHFTSPIRRYSDVIVHRLLAVAINADATYPDLVNKQKTQEVCNNLNYRHRMAQYAGRASVSLHTQLFFAKRVEDEEGYIMFVRKNAIQVLVPKYGLEGTVYLTTKEQPTSMFSYNEDKNTQTAVLPTGEEVVLSTFARVSVQLSIDRSNVQRLKLQMKLVAPAIPGFSVEPVATRPHKLGSDEVEIISLEDEGNMKNKQPQNKKKRKSK